jgi:hypothetical protein
MIPLLRLRTREGHDSDLRSGCAGGGLPGPGRSPAYRDPGFDRDISIGENLMRRCTLGRHALSAK